LADPTLISRRGKRKEKGEKNHIAAEKP